MSRNVCSVCYGQGQIGGSRCTNCGGSGHTRAPQREAARFVCVAIGAS